MTVNKEFIERLNKLNVSPITNLDYHSEISSLLGAIKTILSSARSWIENIEHQENSNKKVPDHWYKSVINELLQADTIANIIEEKAFHDDFVELDNLFFEYRSLINEPK